MCRNETTQCSKAELLYTLATHEPVFEKTTDQGLAGPKRSGCGGGDATGGKLSCKELP